MKAVNTVSQMLVQRYTNSTLTQNRTMNACIKSRKSGHPHLKLVVGILPGLDFVLWDFVCWDFVRLDFVLVPFLYTIVLEWKSFLGLGCAWGSKASIARIMHVWYHNKFAFECRYDELAYVSNASVDNNVSVNALIQGGITKICYFATLWSGWQHNKLPWCISFMDKHFVVQTIVTLSATHKQHITRLLIGWIINDPRFPFTHVNTKCAFYGA